MTIEGTALCHFSNPYFGTTLQNGMKFMPESLNYNDATTCFADINYGVPKSIKNIQGFFLVIDVTPVMDTLRYWCEGGTPG